MIRKYPPIPKRPKNPRVKMNTWIRGVNKLVSNTQTKENELASGTDIQLVEDGKVKCPRDGQSYYGAEKDSQVVGLYPYYKSGESASLLRISGTTLQVYNSGSWDNVSGASYTAGLDTEGVMAFDRLYLTNGTDNLSYYDGTNITSFSAVSAPAAPTVTRDGGSAGTFTFSYKITSVTDVGESLASSAGSTTLNQSTLSSTVKMSVSWSAVTGAIGYNVYGRKDGKWYFITYLEGNGSVSYSDAGAITPSEVFPPPEGDTTTGPKAKYIAVYKDSLFLIGDPDNPSRLYYSAGGDLINDFTIGSGGGFIDIAKNNGQKGVGMIVFKDALLVFKEGSIYSFSFGSEGLPQVQQVTAAVGAVSGRSIVAVENDVFFASSRGIFTIGNESGFAFDVLRTNELSAKIRPVFQTIETTRLEDIAAVYSTVNNTNLVIFSYTPAGSTTNSKAIIYDRERLAWVEWTNLSANCWANFRNSSSVEMTLYGDDSSGYVKRIFDGSDDFGTAIAGSFKLKAVDFKESNIYKKLKDIDIILRQPTGVVTLNLITDGVNTELTVPLTTVSPSVNFAHYVFTQFLFGVSVGEGLSEQDNNLLRTLKNVNIEARSFQLGFANQGTGSFTLLEVDLSAKLRADRFRRSTDLVTIN